MDEEAAEVEAEVAPLLVCVTIIINCSIHAGVNTGPGVGVPPEVCRDAIDWRGEAARCRRFGVVSARVWNASQ